MKIINFGNKRPRSFVARVANRVVTVGMSVYPVSNIFKNGFLEKYARNSYCHVFIRNASWNTIS